jgi:hypothetical protein
MEGIVYQINIILGITAHARNWRFSAPHQHLWKNRYLRQAPNRYAQAVGTTKINLFLASLFIIFVV